MEAQPKIWITIPPKFNVSNYEVSFDGEIRNSLSKHLLKINEGKIGHHPRYQFLCNMENQKTISHQIRHLVAACFLPEAPSDKPMLVNIDGNVKNCCANNLEWATQNIVKHGQIENENWNVLDGLSNYEISTEGRIRHSNTKKLLKLTPSESGYIRIPLVDDNGEKKGHFVHRLVAQTFLPNPENKPQVDHINRKKSNNCVKNLRWATQIENQKNISEKKHVGRKRKVVQFDKDGTYLNTWESCADAVQSLDLPKEKSFNIWATCQKRQKTYAGFGWKFFEDWKKPKDGEEWKEISFAPKYLVSNFGRIKTPTGRISLGTDSGEGYKRFHIGGKTYRVHRLVMEAFSPHECSNELVVNHMNEVRNDNNTKNLEWTTFSDNSIQSTGASVMQYKDETLIATYVSMKEASEKTGAWISSISQCCNGKQKTAGGFQWKKSN